MTESHTDSTVLHGKLHIARVAILERSQGYVVLVNTIQRVSWLEVYTLRSDSALLTIKRCVAVRATHFATIAIHYIKILAIRIK